MRKFAAILLALVAAAGCDAFASEPESPIAGTWIQQPDEDDGTDFPRGGGQVLVLMESDGFVEGEYRNGDFTFYLDGRWESPDLELYYQSYTSSGSNGPIDGGMRGTVRGIVYTARPYIDTGPSVRTITFVKQG